MEARGIQLLRVRGFDLQGVSRALNGLPARVVTRITIFGNPWRIGAEPWMSRDTCLALHETWITGQTTDEDVGPQAAALRRKVLSRLPELRGHNLACTCPLPAPYDRDRCHRRILIELANRPVCEAVTAPTPAFQSDDQGGRDEGSV